MHEFGLEQGGDLLATLLHCFPWHSVLQALPSVLLLLPGLGQSTNGHHLFNSS